MKYDDFLARVKALHIDIKTESYRLSYWERRSGERQVLPEYIHVEWSVGGVSGGSCWDSSNPQPYCSNETEPEFTALDRILEDFKPEITYLQYKNLAASVIEEDSYTVPEYYGNCTNYAVKTVELRKLYDYLVEKEWLK